MKFENLSDKEYLEFLERRSTLLENVYLALEKICGPLKYSLMDFKAHTSMLFLKWMYEEDSFVISTHPMFATVEARDLQRIMDFKKYGVNIFSEDKFMIANYQNKEVKVYLKHLKPDCTFNASKEEFEDVVDELYDTEVLIGPVNYDLRDIRAFPLYDDDFKRKRR